VQRMSVTNIQLPASDPSTASASKASRTAEDAPNARPTTAPPAVKRLVSRCRREWEIARTRLLWGRKLCSLGARSVLSRSLMVPNPRAVAIGSHVTICAGFILADLSPGEGELPKIVIGDGSTILFRFQCNAAQSVTIGKNVLFASNILVTDSDHVVEPGGVPVTRNGKFITRPVRIEDNCWIGQNAVILKGVTIGHDSIIGANTVVTRDVPPCSVVAGNPARIIKTLAVREGGVP
jgi:acetyltransferase-like isoleucine patch superfamily enzyme